MSTSATPWVSLWAHKLWQDLQPTPGRLAGTLRIVLASLVTLVLLLVWQMPFASLGLYFVFLLSRDSPSVSLRSGIFAFLALFSAVAVELGIVALTDNDPVARVLSVAVVTFFGGLLLLSTTAPTLGSTWALIFCTIIAFWENHAPADYLVKTSLWLLATACVSFSTSIAVEYFLGTKDPEKELETARRIRYQAVANLFSLYAAGADAAEVQKATMQVARLAAAGQTGMQKLYDTIVDRNLDTGSLPIGSRVRITMLAQLLDVSAAFGFQKPKTDDAEFRQRYARIAEECRILFANTPAEPFLPTRPETELEFTLLDRVESTLQTISAMPKDTGSQTGNRQLVALPSKKVPFFIPGAIKRPESIAFGLKLSFCATLCYIVYHALDWPGISTSVITVLVTGLSTSAAIKQKMTLRFVGSMIGGLVLGIGAATFIFPHMDTIASLIFLVGAVAFIAAWCAGGPQFNYMGLQIAFSFYIVAFEGFSAPTELQPARDRLLGILLAIIIMWFVFDQLWPVRTIAAMRPVLAAVLRGEDRLVQISESVGTVEQRQLEVDALRDQLGKAVAQLRTLDEVVDYEFGVDHQQFEQYSGATLQAALAATAIFWNHLAILHSERDRDFLEEPRLVEMRRKIANCMGKMADAVVQRVAFHPINHGELVDPGILAEPRYSEHVRNAINRYGELQNLVANLTAATVGMV